MGRSQILNRTKLVFIPKEARAALDQYIENERGSKAGPLLCSRTSKGFVRQEIADLKKVIVEEAADTRRHFDVVAENINQDVAAANADEISLIKDQQLPDHENIDLEEHTGLPTGPRHATLPSTI